MSLVCINCFYILYCYCSCFIYIFGFIPPYNISVFLLIHSDIFTAGGKSLRFESAKAKKQLLRV